MIISPKSLYKKVVWNLIVYLVSSFEVNGEIPILKALFTGNQNVALADTKISKEEVMNRAEEFIDSKSSGPDGVDLQVQKGL